MVFPITSGHASWVSIWNMEKNAFQNMSNFFKFSRWQNNCIDIEPITTRTHIVNNNKLPNFKPGPNILYTKSSSIGEILARRNTRATCNITSRWYQNCKSLPYIHYYIDLDWFQSVPGKLRWRIRKTMAWYGLSSWWPKVAQIFVLFLKCTLSIQNKISVTNGSMYINNRSVNFFHIISGSPL